MVTYYLNDLLFIVLMNFIYNIQKRTKSRRVYSLKSSQFPCKYAQLLNPTLALSELIRSNGTRAVGDTLGEYFAYSPDPLLGHYNSTHYSCHTLIRIFSTDFREILIFHENSSSWS